MIQTSEIESALNLTNVTLTVTQGIASIVANEMVTEEMQNKVQKWYNDGGVNLVPTQVRNAQLRQWLIDKDLDELVETKLSTSENWPDIKTWKKAKSRYEYEPNVNRNDPLVESLGRDLGMNSEQLDSAFFEISQIP